MRTIKFRAWYGGGLGKMVYFGEPVVSNTELEHGETWGMFFPIIQGKAYISSCVPMQFTGLHDKNGKEIYEGDIVEEYPMRKEIAWGGHWNYAGFGLHGKREKPHSPEDPLFTWDPLNPEWAKNIEIIGNIYENPELLRG